jgi:micrococcal nuclease
MRRIFLAIALCLLCASAYAAPPPIGPFQATVAGCHDGDSCTLVLPDHSLLSIRLHIADCPEVPNRHDPRTQAYGPEATTFTHDLVYGKTVTVHIIRDKHGNPVKSYQRYVADIDYRGDDLALDLIRHGLAWVDPRYTTPVAAYQTYYAAENDAHAHQSGLWRDIHPIEPWVFRHEEH